MHSTNLVRIVCFSGNSVGESSRNCHQLQVSYIGLDRCRDEIDMVDRLLLLPIISLMILQLTQTLQFETCFNPNWYH